jgi:hypothetical protein
MTTKGISQEIIFDRETSSVRYSESKIAEPSVRGDQAFPAGTILERYQLLEQGLVDRLTRNKD